MSDTCSHGVPNEHGFCAECDKDTSQLAPYVLYLDKEDYDRMSQRGDLHIWGGAFTVEPHTWEAPMYADEVELREYYKVTLQPGTRIEYSYGGDTDEGYSYTSREVKVDWSAVYDRELWSDEQATRSSDCDGPHESYYDKWSDGLPYDQNDSSYHAGFPERSRCLKEMRRQRDTFAERMGY